MEQLEAIFGKEYAYPWRKLKKKQVDTFIDYKNGTEGMLQN